MASSGTAKKQRLYPWLGSTNKPERRPWAEQMFTIPIFLSNRA